MSKDKLKLLGSVTFSEKEASYNHGFNAGWSEGACQALDQVRYLLRSQADSNARREVATVALQALIARASDDEDILNAPLVAVACADALLEELKEKL